MCPFTRKFSRVAAERDYAARPAWEAEWDRDPDDPDDDGPTEAVIPTTDGPALVDLMRMSEDEWDAYTRGSAMRRAGYSGLRRNVAIALGNWLAVSDTPDPEAMGELVAALSDEDPVVAEAAAWGLGRVGPWSARSDRGIGDAFGWAAWCRGSASGCLPPLPQPGARLLRLLRAGRATHGRGQRTNWGPPDSTEVLSRQPRSGPMRTSLMVTLLVALAFGGAQPDPSPPRPQDAALRRAAWLAGCWRHTSPRGQIDEQWMELAGDAMIGMSRTIREGRVLEFEHLRIEAREDGVSYVAKPSRQPETAFQLAPASGPVLLFENPDHDFPTTIAYTPLGADSMRATIAGSGREVPFLFARVACGKGEAAGKSDDLAR